MTPIEEGRRISRLIAGALLLLVGLLFLMQNLGWTRAGRLGDYWPLLLVWVGLTRMFAPRRGRHFATGAVIFALGVLFQLDRLDLVSFSLHEVWPLFLILAGVALIVEAWLSNRAIARTNDYEPGRPIGPGASS